MTLPIQYIKKVGTYIRPYDRHTGAYIFYPKRLVGVVTVSLLTTTMLLGIVPATKYIYEKIKIDDFRVAQEDIVVTDTTYPTNDSSSQSVDVTAGSEAYAAGNTGTVVPDAPTPSKAPTAPLPEQVPEEEDPDVPEKPDEPAPPEPPTREVPPPRNPRVKPIRIVAVGDIACDPTNTTLFNNGVGGPRHCHFKQLGDAIRRQSPNAVLLLGDLQYPYGRLDRYRGSFGTYWQDILKKSYPIPGNHDYKDYKNPAQTGIEDAYFKFFSENTNAYIRTALQAKDANGVRKGYYSFDLASGATKWHIIGLNTNYLCQTVRCGLDSEQARWLRNDIALNSSTRCSIAMSHYPPTNSSAQEERYDDPTSDAYKSRVIGNNIFKNQLKGKVDIALYGHSHKYERLAKDGGTRQFVVGLGGKSFSTVPTNPADRVGEFLYAGKAGFLQIDLYEDHYIWSLINESSRVIDAGTDTCI
jgi:predicted phosphodiesterase